MIHVSTQISQRQLARTLVDNPEELAEFLREVVVMSHVMRRHLLDDLATELGPDERVIAFLRDLADALEPAEGQS